MAFLHCAAEMEDLTLNQSERRWLSEFMSEYTNLIFKIKQHQICLNELTDNERNVRQEIFRLERRNERLLTDVAEALLDLAAKK